MSEDAVSENFPKLGNIAPERHKLFSTIRFSRNSTDITFSFLLLTLNSFGFFLTFSNFKDECN